jgi:hypothetical protein
LLSPLAGRLFVFPDLFISINTEASSSSSQHTAAPTELTAVPISTRQTQEQPETQSPDLPPEEERRQKKIKSGGREKTKVKEI